MTAVIRVAGVIMCVIFVVVGLVRAAAPGAPADYSCRIPQEPTPVQNSDFCCQGSLHHVEGDVSGPWHRA